jgi:outer membrane lipoprotein-sorting protein
MSDVIAFAKRSLAMRTVSLWLALAALSIALPLVARAETAREMLDKAKAVNDAREPKDGSQKMKMTLFDSRGGERLRDIEVYSKNYGPRTRKAITFFLSPPEVKGVGLLAWSYPDKDDDQWLYLPELKRVRQISSNTRKQSFQGSDFSYEDLELFDDIRDWTEKDATSKLVKEGEVADGVPCAVIELTPQGKDYQYSRFVVWLDGKDATFRKVDFYDKNDNTLLKTLVLTGFKTIDNLPTPHHIEMANAKKNTKTVMEISDVRYNRGLSDDVFTQRTLEHGRVD